MKSLWGDEFVIEETKKQAKKILNKVDKPKKIRTDQQILKSKTASIEDKLRIINKNVYDILGVYADNTLVIKDIETLSNYIGKAMSNGIIAIDTETNNSLDPLTCKLMGPCLYTPDMKNAYIPVNHINYQTGERYDWQITEEQIKEQFDRLVKNNVKIITHNGKFDYEVLKCTTGFDMPIYWDTMVGARLLNENERAGLKQQYIEKIDSSIEKYSIDHLFNIDYAVVDPQVFALYAATDSYMTYKLYEYQKKEFEQAGNEKLYSLFMDIEMPCVEVLANMELNGVCIDTDFAHRLSEKYHKKSEEIDSEILQELNKLEPQISAWRNTSEANVHLPNKNDNTKVQKSLNEKLKSPPEVSSPTQLAILLYDVLKVPAVDSKSPRGTGVDYLSKIDIPLCKLILQKRQVDKLLSTYIDKLPLCINENTGKIHTKFNQLGADTGRQSSDSPNLQNIPSHENSIRMMFCASPGCVLVGSDYSQQEPRLLAQYSNDKNMINSYVNGKDLYASIAEKVYNIPYEQNKEFLPDGTMNPEGKRRRSNMKSILLGLMYGRGVASIAEQIKAHPGEVTNEDIKEAVKVQKDFFNEFPNVRNWIEHTQKVAHECGYVEDLWGRRRRLPDIQLPKFEVHSNHPSTTFNPLLNSKGIVKNKLTEQIDSYIAQLENCNTWAQCKGIIEKLQQQGYEVKNNGGFISAAERQCVNARIQGGAATITKLALRKIYDDSVLNELKFKILLSVHDEIIGECPIENAEQVKVRLSEVMADAAKPICTIPMKCDADSFPCWYYDVYTADIREEFLDTLNKLQDSNNSFSIEYYKQQALQYLVDNHTELLYNDIYDIVKDLI